MWFVYILITQKGQLYTGITKDIERRLKEHKRGCGSRFMRTFGFQDLLYSEKQPTRSDALKREAQIKTWPRERKLRLIQKEGSL